ncbi:hypothetical protein TOTORO_02250 [Serratia phage vB_SmaS-Totoro]|nr:hypothetical protein TOTORO_02250 [Serratia phage vB_SmaS-Totoro]
MSSFVEELLRKASAKKLTDLEVKTSRSSYKEWCKLSVKYFSETHAPWLESYDIFLNDVGEPPCKEYALHRLDQMRKFEPGNIVWIGPKGAQYAKNRPYSIRSNSKKIEWEGILYTVPEFAAKFNLSAHTIYWRMRNWPKKDWAGRVS